MKIGYICSHNLGLNPHLTERFEFKEATFTRTINLYGDKVHSKILAFPVDYKEIVDNTEIMKNLKLILTNEPFLLDAEFREKIVAWVELANKVYSEGSTHSQGLCN